MLSIAPNLPRNLRVLDLCTGVGCIPLPFQHQLSRRRPDTLLRMVGVDISPDALQLARDNTERVLRDAREEYNVLPPQTQALEQIKYIPADVLGKSPDHPTLEAALVLKPALNPGESRVTKGLRAYTAKTFHILICNHPYISPSDFLRTTSRSVREFEPELALVPPPNSAISHEEEGDVFYPRLLEIAHQAKAIMVLFEVADLSQALRVARIARRLGKELAHEHARMEVPFPDRVGWDEIQIWRDEPGKVGAIEESQTIDGFEVIGRGNGRSVFYSKHHVRDWFSSSDKLRLREQIIELSTQGTS
ncbi:uncharacterized protein BDZ99DRAFT_526960 [Mytilinidion resinicola]|uniref:S-adenosyl-L-methionine-dependent methyltransferase n=1 Tax=Mytilinidion resinicola TaxID=574789 RepID=A0A6A6Y246_9PEZI|nr:uncharacterized protein BDZ99DRAFT_526960 [Mytilinidion resinicola]KAF2802852.1 hypothetical protein BDZ99DRAFT_526960 [Mytilinidion resinicola]